MKKISLFLIAALTLCLMQVSVLARNTASVLSSEGNKTLLSNIGIVLPEKTENESITRSEYVSALVGLIVGNVGIQTEIPFADVLENDVARDKIAYAYSLGIISVDSTFRPNDPITYPEAYTMAVKLLGRNTEAQMAGGYPSGYEKIAEKLELTKNVNRGEQLTFSDMCTILVNIGQCELLETKDGKTYAGDETLFEKSFDLHYIRGIVTANENTGLYDEAQNAAEGMIKIDGSEYLYDGEITVGYRVCGYATETDDENKIVYLEPYKNDTMQISLSKLDDSGTDDKLYYTDGTNKLKNVSIKQPAAVLYNGKAANKLTVTDILKLGDGSIELVDNDADGKYEVIVIWEYKNYIIKNVNLHDKKLLGENIKKLENANMLIDLSDSDTRYTISSVDGEIQLFDIRVGSLVSAYISQDEKYIRLYLNNNSVSGTANSVSPDDQKIKIDGTEYEYSDYFRDNYLSNMAMGAEYTFLLTDSGIVAAISGKASTQMRYGYLVKVIYDENEELLNFKIYTEDGINEVYEGAEKIRFNNVTLQREKIPAELGSGQNTKRQLIRFSTDDSGKLRNLDSCDKKGRVEKNPNPYDSLTRFVFPAAAYEKLYWVQDTNAFPPYVYLNSSTKIFVVDNSDSAADDKRATLKSGNYFVNNRNQQITPTSEIKDVTEFYDVTGNGVVGAMVVYDQAASDPKVEDDSPVGVVYNVCQAVDPDNDLTYEITMFTEGRYNRYYLSDDAAEKFVQDDGKYMVEKGDLMRYALTVDNKISALACDYDMSEQKLNYTLPNNENGTHLSKGVLYSGTLYDFEGSMITIVPTGVPGITPDPSDETARFSFRFSGDVYVVEPDGNLINISDTGEMMPYLQAGKDNCSKIFIRTSDGQPEFAVIYK